MSKSIPSADPAAVSSYILKLDPIKRELSQAIRQSILSTDKRIAEHIKWNAPAFFYTGEMRSSDPKEYKRDLIVFNLRQKDHVLLILPNGQGIAEVSSILEGDYTDGRRMVRLKDIAELGTKEKELRKVIKALLKHIA
jgi:uncharacterized protein YdhG (YjbR/CyaY superfamily)